MTGFRDRFLDDYIAVEKPRDGRTGVRIHYIYQGPWYIWAIAPHPLLVAKIVIASSCLLNIALYLYASSRRTGLNQAVAVAVPATLSLIALMFEAIGAGQFCASRRRMTRATYRGIDAKLKVAPLSHAVLLLTSSAACLMQPDLRRADTKALLAACGYFVCAGLSAFILFRYRAIPFTSERNRVLDESAQPGG